MRSLGVADAAKKVAGTKRKAPASSAKQPAAPAAPARRSSRARAEVSYKEPTMKEFEAAFAAEDDGTAAAGAAAKAAHPRASRSGYARRAQVPVRAVTGSHRGRSRRQDG